MNGTNILHIATLDASVNGLRYLIREEANLCAKLWVRDDNGKLPEDHTPKSMSPKPREILESLLNEATQKLLSGNYEEKDVVLLDAFHATWLRTLYRGNEVEAQSLCELKNVPTRLKTHLILLRHLFAIKEVATEDRVLTRSMLQQLISCADISLNAQMNLSFFVARPNSEFLRQLLCVFKKIRTEKLSSLDIHSMHVVLVRYLDTTKSWDTRLLDKLLASKLLNSLTFKGATQGSMQTLGLP